jgi:hypothetical protein
MAALAYCTSLLYCTGLSHVTVVLRWPIARHCCTALAYCTSLLYCTGLLHADPVCSNSDGLYPIINQVDAGEGPHTGRLMGPSIVLNVQHNVIYII